MSFFVLCRVKETDYLIKQQPLPPPFLVSIRLPRYRSHLPSPVFLMFFSSRKKNPHDTCCMTCHIVVAFFLFLTSVSALVGVVMAHYNADAGVLVFGSMTGSLSLLAFAVSLSLWMHAMKNCMSACDACGVNGKK